MRTLRLLLSHPASSFPFPSLDVSVAKESLKANGLALQLGPQSTAPFRILWKTKQILIMKQIIQLNKKQQLGIARILCEYHSKHCLMFWNQIVICYGRFPQQLNFYLSRPCISANHFFSAHLNYDYTVKQISPLRKKYILRPDNTSLTDPLIVLYSIKQCLIYDFKHSSCSLLKWR